MPVAGPDKQVPPFGLPLPNEHAPFPSRREIQPQTLEYLLLPPKGSRTEGERKRTNHPKALEGVSKPLAKRKTNPRAEAFFRSGKIGSRKPPHKLRARNAKGVTF